MHGWLNDVLWRWKRWPYAGKPVNLFEKLLPVSLAICPVTVCILAPGLLISLKTTRISAQPGVNASQLKIMQWNYFCVCLFNFEEVSVLGLQTKIFQLKNVKGE